jgi:hypothetical protein
MGQTAAKHVKHKLSQTGLIVQNKTSTQIYQWGFSSKYLYFKTLGVAGAVHAFFNVKNDTFFYLPM